MELIIMFDFFLIKINDLNTCKLCSLAIKASKIELQPCILNTQHKVKKSFETFKFHNLIEKSFKT
jgi:hypothetical protein